MLVPLVTASQVAFWALAPVAVALAIGMVISRKPVHSALCLGGVMLTLAVQYASMDAPFLFVTQIIVYTGSIMMLFVFTMMLIGVDTRESLVETLKGQRAAAIVLVLGTLALLILAVGSGVYGNEAGLADANAAQGGNVEGLAYLVLSRYVVVFEATAALLVTGALAAMVLAHADTLTPKERQRNRMIRRMREYAERGAHPGPLPNSGVYARHNSTAYPALLPDGSIAESSVSPTLADRGIAIVEPGGLRAATREAFRQINTERADALGRVLDPIDELTPAGRPALPARAETGEVEA